MKGVKEEKLFSSSCLPDHVEIIIREENSKCHHKNFRSHSARNLCRCGTGMTGVPDKKILIPLKCHVRRALRATHMVAGSLLYKNSILLAFNMNLSQLEIKDFPTDIATFNA
jgi:hypothetical protein